MSEAKNVVQVGDEQIEIPEVLAELQANGPGSEETV